MVKAYELIFLVQIQFGSFLVWPNITKTYKPSQMTIQVVGGVKDWYCWEHLSVNRLYKKKKNYFNVLSNSDLPKNTTPVLIETPTFQLLFWIFCCEIPTYFQLLVKSFAVSGLWERGIGSLIVLVIKTTC